ncbi:MAG: 50S ribosomal protein L4 [Ruminococcaceae bacterium]|nr:50S ribosomal protein L4 [Oscillospiraceae bacterium]
MPKVALYNVSGATVGEIELNDAIFGQEVNGYALHEVVKNYLANQRQGTQSTKTRTEVSGGGIKPWRQKGTGRARQGSIRAPQWTGGGVALGPKPRSYRYALNKKLKRAALKSALSAKVADESMIVVDQFGFEEIKTKQIVSMLDALKVEGKALIITCDKDDNVVLSARNIPTAATTFATALNTYDVLNSDKVIVSKDAIAKIEEVYA